VETNVTFKTKAVSLFLTFVAQQLAWRNGDLFVFKSVVQFEITVKIRITNI
jgi:hypothetical protein